MCTVGTDVLNTTKIPQEKERKWEGEGKKGEILGGPAERPQRLVSRKRRVGGPKFRAFFPPSLLKFHSLCSIWASFVEFRWCLKCRGPPKCTFGVLGLSCEAPAASGSRSGGGRSSSHSWAQSRQGFTQQPESPKVHIWGSRPSTTPPKFNETTPKRGRKNEGKKKSEILGGPAEGGSRGRGSGGGRVGGGLEGAPKFWTHPQKFWTHTAPTHHTTTQNNTQGGLGKGSFAGKSMAQKQDMSNKLPRKAAPAKFFGGQGCSQRFGHKTVGLKKTCLRLSGPKVVRVKRGQKKQKNMDRQKNFPSPKTKIK